MGGSNQSLFLLGALVATQGSAAIPLLVVGLLLSWAAIFGWTELILMWPRRVGGIASTCAEAFRPYSPVLANLTGVCYWWGWVPTCGLTAILSAAALHQWYLPGVPVKLLAVVLVLVFMAVNLAGIRWVARLALPIAFVSAGLALLSAIVPMLAGTVDWHRATSFELHSPFQGFFGGLTSAMAGLYLIGFAAPAFEAAACHVGETRNPARNVPRAMFASAGMASIYFVALPVIWLGVLGSHSLEGDLTHTLDPTFAPLLGASAKAAAVWFMVFNMFHGTLQPLAGASRTLAQLAEDGLLPRMLARRARSDAPWVATMLTAGMSIAFLMTGDPVWVIAAANFCYLIGIGLPSVAVWLLRRNEPDRERPYRAPRGTIGLGLIAACAWGVSTVLGFQQFGLPTVIASLGLAYAGSLLYAARVFSDRRRAGKPGFARSLHLKLTGAMVAVIALDSAGYLLAVSHVPRNQVALITLLEDIFVGVAILTVTVGLVLPGMISHATGEVARAAERLAAGTIADLSRAMRALTRGRLDEAAVRDDVEPVVVHSRDEVGSMATSFNVMQRELAGVAQGLERAREGLRASKEQLERDAARQRAIASLGGRALKGLGVDALMEEATESVRDMLDVDIALALEVQPLGRWFSVRAASGLVLGGQRLTLAAGTSTQAGATHVRGEAIAVRDVWQDTSYALPEALRELGVRSGLTVPIAGQGTGFGVLAVYGRSAREFGEHEVNFLRSVAHILADAAERGRSEERTRHEALHDPLTGLPNRALFGDRLSIALRRAERTLQSVSVVLLDLDNFKLINDTRGHTTGDELLCAVAARLDESLRPGDTVARFGGDEFVLICDGLGGAEDARMLAERTAMVLKRPFLIDGVEHFVTASIGLAVSRAAGQRSEDLIRDADAAMYRAKELGRGRCELFDEAMRERALARLQITSELRRAIDRDELRVVYQPVVSLPEGKVVGVEALVRWEHPDRGLVPPAGFVAVAEDTGLIVPIGRWVLREACRQMAAWQRANPAYGELYAAVNLSPRQATRGDLPLVVGEALSDSGLDPSCLHLEITESVLMEEADVPAQTLQAFKSIGVGLVLDDFGTGYSSLAYLRRFPIDRLKVDRAFVAGLGDSPHDNAIVEAILRMGDTLGVEVIAEGVETEAQAQTLVDLGCRFAQGYLYARPLSAAEVVELLGSCLPARVAV
jgi:diguanylate cyclase (GGDEF)-like protein